MISTNSLLPPIDKESQRRRALAKVYTLLIRLAEEQDNQTSSPDAIIEEERNIVEPNLVQLELSI